MFYMCTVKLYWRLRDDIQEMGEFLGYIYRVEIRIQILDLYQIIIEVFFVETCMCEAFARLLSNFHVLSIITKLGYYAMPIGHQYRHLEVDQVLSM